VALRGRVVIVGTCCLLYGQSHQKLRVPPRYVA
jgi:hypothetical protein